MASFVAICSNHNSHMVGVFYEIQFPAGALRAE